ncbi:hypothetical protein ACIQU6_06330 [Streptomyces sp. NPDC090442]|uniref:hypothetical protein n=1 Tax=Streptomyces sp. NPDC090442 TaxID=3365962 RepID=UPI00382FCE23
MGPYAHGYEISLGDELGIGNRLECCDEEMTVHTNDGGASQHVCDTCCTTVRVRGDGLVADIWDYDRDLD